MELKISGLLIFLLNTRSYRSGYVWHDLCEDDMVCPTNGNEYILKGSELLEGALCPTPGKNSLFDSAFCSCSVSSFLIICHSKS